jgi:CRP/FNR family transcriptional regulator, carbon monoxide oxidation system transcription regulator
MISTTSHATDLLAIVQAGADDALLAGFCLRRLPPGYLLSDPAAAEDQVFIVRSGRLKVSIVGENRELSLSFLEAGDIYTTHTPTYVRAVVASEIWTIDTHRFARKLAETPAITPVMMRVLGRLLNDAVTLVEDLAFHEVPVRLARFFLGLAKRRGQRLDDGWRVPVDLGTQDIAELLGATRQTISALINQWEREGLLARHGRRVYLIPSLEALAVRFGIAA